MLAASSTSSSAGPCAGENTRGSVCHGTASHCSMVPSTVNLEHHVRAPSVAPPQHHPELVRQGLWLLCFKMVFSFADLQTWYYILYSSSLSSSQLVFRLQEGLIWVIF